MPHVYPEDYSPKLDILTTQKAIKVIKDTFENELAGALGLTRVSAPLFVEKSSGLNDDLNGVERPVSFDLLEQPDREVSIIHSLAKWKRYALGRYAFPHGRGLYTDMNAIRRDESTDNLHSVYVDQWDWEKVISDDQRNEQTLREAVGGIHESLVRTHGVLRRLFPDITTELPESVTFFRSDELCSLYPDMSAEQRELQAVREHGACFFIGIGWPLADGRPHDRRAPDYDDWTLNGDLVYYHKTLDCRMEISSMGIRVDEKALRTQLAASGCEDRSSLPFHNALLKGKLPLTMGGGIGQSRLCMLLLGKAHIGEVQASIWPEHAMELYAAHGVTLL